MSETKDKILDAAERLFASQGYGGTSLRHIIAEAGVNLAAIHYHFGSKEELLEELIRRQAEPINALRLSMLEAFQAEAGDAPVAVEKILEAFLVPAADWAADHPESIRLMGRVHAEAFTPAIMEKYFREVGLRFFNALGSSLPHLTKEELTWRFEFMIGSMAVAMTGKLSALFGMAQDSRGKAKSLITFLAGGYHAPATKARESEVNQ